jgi:multiple sugar transport system substrate-binding protein
VLAVTVSATALVLSGCGSQDVLKTSEPVHLRFSWWGTEDGAATTTRMIELFQSKNPGIVITGEHKDFNSYFDDLNARISVDDAPDIITLGGAYPGEYGAKGALVDLATLSEDLHTDGIDEAILEQGTFDGIQYGVPTGVSTFTPVADPTVFKAAGVALPDDDTWTWTDLARIAHQITAASPRGTYGLADPVTSDFLDLYSRQRGESLYTEDGGIAVSAATLQSMWKMSKDLLATNAIPPVATTWQLTSLSAPEDSLIGRGLAGLQFDLSNQLSALTKGAGHELTLLRPPGESTEDQPGLWLQASQFYTINAKCQHPKEAAKFVNFLVNDPEAGKLVLTDRGVPGNSAVRNVIAGHLDSAQNAQVAFIDRISSRTGPPLVIGPKGSTSVKNILRRINLEVLNGTLTPQDAALQFRKLLTTAIT